MYSGLETRMYASNANNSPCNSAAYVSSQGGLESYVGVSAFQEFLVDMPYSIDEKIDNTKHPYQIPAGNYEVGKNGIGTIGTEKIYTNNITHGLLRKNRPLVQFVRGTEEVKDIVKETFRAVVGEELPKDIMIHVLNEEEIKESHRRWGGQWNPGIMGFAINDENNGRLVFAKNNDVDALMLTIGHEIGHVLTPRLENQVNEEAKAFAFERAWAQAIVENDIGGLSDNFDPGFIPAANGLHDRAFGYVQKLVSRGKRAIEVFKGLAKGAILLQDT